MSSNTAKKERFIAKDLLPSSMPGMEYKIAIAFPRDIAGKVVLDIGSGTNDCVPWLSSVGAKAYAIDFRYRDKEQLIESSRLSMRKVAEKVGTNPSAMKYMDSIRESFLVFFRNFNGPNSSYAAAYAGQLPFADNTFDFVFSTNCITHGLDQDFYVLRSAVDESMRVLKPGGEFQAYPFLGSCDKYLRKNHRKIAEYMEEQGFTVSHEPATGINERLRVKKSRP